MRHTSLSTWQEVYIVSAWWAAGLSLWKKETSWNRRQHLLFQTFLNVKQAVAQSRKKYIFWCSVKLLWINKDWTARNNDFHWSASWLSLWVLALWLCTSIIKQLIIGFLWPLLNMEEAHLFCLEQLTASPLRWPQEKMSWEIWNGAAFLSHSLSTNCSLSHIMSWWNISCWHKEMSSIFCFKNMLCFSWT